MLHQGHTNTGKGLVSRLPRQNFRLFQVMPNNSLQHKKDILGEQHFGDKMKTYTWEFLGKYRRAWCLRDKFIRKICSFKHVLA